MRHRISGYKLGRDAEDRRSLRRNMAIAVLTRGQITTTLPKAKSVQPFVERLITIARRGDLTARRRVLQALGNPFYVPFDLKDHDRAKLKGMGYTVNKYHELQDGPRLVKRFFDEIAPQFKDRPGGYTRIIKLARHRIADGADLVVLQLVGKEEGPQVAGQFSRRRQKANHRMDFAAKRRRSAAEPAAAAAPAAPAPAAEAPPKA
jgi:large subunit ribosomal protein L17